MARLRAWISRHRGLTAAGITSVVAGLAFILIWFQPQRLLVNDRVNEAVPQAITSPALTHTHDSSPAPATTSSPASPAPASTPMTVSAGPFRSLEHPTRGLARIITLADGRSYLRLEGFRTSSGPDVVVRLSPGDASSESHANQSGSISLGALKGNIGNQNYAIPVGVDLTAMRSAWIWCRRFTSGFGVAALRIAA